MVVRHLFLNNEVARVNGVLDYVSYSLEQATNAVDCQCVPCPVYVKILMIGKLPMLHHVAQFDVRHRKGFHKHCCR